MKGFLTLAMVLLAAGTPFAKEYTPLWQLKEVPKLGLPAGPFTELDLNTFVGELCYAVHGGPDPSSTYVLFFFPAKSLDEADLKEEDVTMILLKPRKDPQEDVTKRKLTAYVEFKEGKAVGVHLVPEMNKDRVLSLATRLMNALNER